MTAIDGLTLLAGGGELIATAGMTLKVGAERSKNWSAFEAVVQPGFDVGAHRHGAAEELFFVIEGELDLLAFEPRNMIGGDWHAWESKTGDRFVRAGAGATMSVPPGCPHAFYNPTDTPARLLFIVTPAGHEVYLRELGDLLAAGGPPDQAAIAAIRARHDIEQLTPLKPGRRP